MPQSKSSVWLGQMDRVVDEVLARVQGEIVLAIPLGIGKPNPLVNALYRRIKAMPERRLRLMTALSLERPVGKSALERNFLKPLLDRVFEDYPDLDYVKDARAGLLPANVAVHEFFFKTGDYLGNAQAQQHYVCTNYSFVVRDMMIQGVNLIMQAVAPAAPLQAGAPKRLSLSCNPELSFDLVEGLRAQGRPLLAVAMVNEQLPFMGGAAEASDGFFDLVLDAPGCSHAVFAPPNSAVGSADYAIGLHASSLVPDGGTLQIGIGSLGDAIAQALILRDRQPEAYGEILRGLCPAGLQGRELGPFKQGLYGCSEMFVNGFLRLIDAGIVRRLVFEDLDLQALAGIGLLGDAPDLNALLGLLQRGRVGAALSAHDLVYLQDHGLLRSDVSLQGGELCRGEIRCANDLLAPTSQACIAQHLLGERWRRAAVLHGGFFLGPRDFYQRLREMPEALRERIAMTRISHVNEIFDDGLGSEALKRAQRVKARFINTTMKMTLLGAAASDALESQQLVSGVGGQYNFVAQAHALPDARSILLLRSCYTNHGHLRSNIVWNYGHVTIPRHLRDIVITEYGVADLRGQSDSEVIKRLLAIADSRFQAELIRAAQAHGKLEPGYQLPAHCRRNLPQHLSEVLSPWRRSGQLPDYPFGTDLDADELKMARALKQLKAIADKPWASRGTLLRSLLSQRQAPAAYLQRLGLDGKLGLKDWVIKKLFVAQL
ncbi:acetyl-CoA hydrolase [Paucibacter sp. KBW04]|uniref:acetyl-CoA hydrolase/transferase C-terminal domain-containing protein n=1 Tax=Paucibacter sp. KBW04 TaxID=2153361 RepID=UPI000F576A05|nr:acetyl-CoA hydrolase/transferase C-terminal domain-containing protein [Paucibacter sp. KBW04]RQO62567.1 acetyl-CoA hydrolase [Paucibacter sp. KBW04]